ncbi:hypothetical protein RRG08_038728 [Elysia crispata]|uniref:Uncharacterized protein n=1 Tax=Elysia crispata TaxID=231223 RepID=A0AAE0ZKP6_9GAST|nr:hypothetical protein RRG08_038728 [Elysia crispata]
MQVQNPEPLPSLEQIKHVGSDLEFGPLEEEYSRILLLAMFSEYRKNLYRLSAVIGRSEGLRVKDGTDLWHLDNPHSSVKLQLHISQAALARLTQPDPGLTLLKTRSAGQRQTLKSIIECHVTFTIEEFYLAYLSSVVVLYTLLFTVLPAIG